MAETNIHASCVAIGASGVLLLGPSGAGKSGVALQLIDGGAVLVADDRTILFVRNGALHAKAPPSIKGLIEIRAVGIVKMRARPTVRLALAVRLGREDERLPRAAFYRRLGMALPQIRLNARHAATPAKIRAALAAFSQRSFRDTYISKE